MSDFSLAGDTPPHGYRVAKSNSTTHVAPAASQTGVKSWQIDILVVVVGLSALVFFVALGGAFALLGPGVIYMGILATRKRACSGRKLLRIITGAAMFFLSAAALLAPAHTGVWRIVGSILGLLASAIYLATTLLTMHKTCTLI